MASATFRRWWQRVLATGDIGPLRLGATRGTVRAILGEPDAVSTVRRGEPGILKYEALELHFAPGADGGLFLIWTDDEDGAPLVRITRGSPSLLPPGNPVACGRLYRYAGPRALLDGVRLETSGERIAAATDLDAWLRAHPEGAGEGATFVVDHEGALLVAPRRSEHVACAAGGPVRAAGELRIVRRAGTIAVVGASNLSTGYCPEPSSWQALRATLDRLGVAHPGALSVAFEFRRCRGCRQINVVKDDWFFCDACGSALPCAWNLDDENPSAQPPKHTTR